jgi:anti-sigma B factor antagonist
MREERIGNVTVLETRGRIDSTTASAFGEKLMGAIDGGGQGVVVDLQQLEYISSAGFRALLLAAKRADQHGSRFVLCEIVGKTRQLFDLGGFLDVFVICGSREEGIAAAQ